MAISVRLFSSSASSIFGCFQNFNISLNETYWIKNGVTMPVQNFFSKYLTASIIPRSTNFYNVVFL